MASQSPNHYIKVYHKIIQKVVDNLLLLKKLGVEDPRRVIHSLKVGLAITMVSTLYYYKPLYNEFGSSAMWAVFTAVLILEFSVGATLGKGLNRGLATFVAGALGLGCSYLAELTGHMVEPILLGVFVFLGVAGATYFRFFPQIKKRYDYGLLVFNLTFCLVSVSSYREEDILHIAQIRLVTILIGGLISVLVCILVCPIWAGDDLHNLVSTNIEKLGNFLQGFGDEYFKTSKNGICSNKGILEGYRSVLNSKQTEESLANFATWEPCHGQFKFHHPWHQYLKIGSLSRQCAYRIDALNGFLNSTKEPPAEIRRKLQDSCMKMSRETGKCLKELSVAMKRMIPPLGAEGHISIAKSEAMKLSSMLKSETEEREKGTNLLEAIIPAVTVASLLMDVVSCTEQLAESMKELSSLASFSNKDHNTKVAPQNQTGDSEDEGPHHHVVTIIHHTTTADASN